MRRRQFGIALLGSAATALAWRAEEAGVLNYAPGAAYEPWLTWSSGSGLLRAVRAAILAASPHNTQPWLFRVSGDQVELLADRSRNIGAIDPLRREQHIGMGCCLENLKISAEASGFIPLDMVFDQDRQSDRIAAIRFAAGRPKESVLFGAIPHRHTNRGPYQAAKPIPSELLREMDGLNEDKESVRLHWWLDKSDRARFTRLVVAAAEAIVTDREQSRDSYRWYRGTPAEIARHRDGITLDAQGLSPALNVIAKMLPAASPALADRIFLSNTRRVHCATAPAFGTIAVRNPLDKADRVRAGRLWQRLHLWATANGVAMQPLNQVHERIDREVDGHPGRDRFAESLSGLLRQPGWSGIFSFRAGYAVRAAARSPRRDLADVLL